MNRTAPDVRKQTKRPESRRTKDRTAPEVRTPSRREQTAQKARGPLRRRLSIKEAVHKSRGPPGGKENDILR